MADSMPSLETIGWIFFPIFLALMAWWYGIQLRYFIRRSSSRRWPVVNAVIRNAGVRRQAGPKGAPVFGSDFDYRYTVNGAQYAGIFTVICGEDQARRLQDTLNGGINIRYNPRDPKMSFLSDQYDQRFGGIAATQNPEWLDGG
jgi:hypothetical protein